jgi:hypothetical protein
MSGACLGGESDTAIYTTNQQAKEYPVTTHHEVDVHFGILRVHLELLRRVQDGAQAFRKLADLKVR